MAQKLIKVEYPPLDCRGLYYIDDNFAGKLITKELAPTGRATYKFVLRQKVSVLGKGQVTKKKTYTIEGQTFYKAIEEVIGKREAHKKSIIDKVTGVAKQKEDEAIVMLRTIDDVWELYYHHRKTSVVQGKRQKKWKVEYSVKGNPTGGTAYIMQSAYNSLIKPKFGKKIATQVKKKDIEDLINDSVDNRGFSPRYVKNIIDILKPMYEWFYDREEIDKRNPAGNVSVYFDNKRNVEVSFEDMQKLYKTMLTYNNKKYRNVFLWLVTGRRVGEVLSLHTDNIEGDYFTVTSENNKAGVDMIYKMSPAMKKIVPKSSYVHTSVKDSSLQLSKASVDRHWKNIKRDSGLFDLHIHDLRHLITTVLKDSGVPLELRSMVLGHKSSSMTERYNRETKAQADMKLQAVSFFMSKISGSLDIDLKWDEYKKQQVATK